MEDKDNDFLHIEEVNNTSLNRLEFLGILNEWDGSCLGLALSEFLGLVVLWPLRSTLKLAKAHHD